MNVSHYTPKASREVRVAIMRLVGIRQFGKTLGSIGVCVCHRDLPRHCPNFLIGDIQHYVNTGQMEIGNYRRNGQYHYVVPTNFTGNPACECWETSQWLICCGKDTL